jgi:hypothetical protein
MIPAIVIARNNDAATLIEAGECNDVHDNVYLFLLNLGAESILHILTHLTSFRAGHYQGAILGLSMLSEEFRTFVCNSGDDCSQFNPSMSICLDQCMVLGEDEGVEQASPFIYNIPIRMPSRVELEKDRNKKISSVLLFNLALAHQLSADSAKSSERYSVILSKALALYELAFRVQESGEYFGGNILFTLAILNNIGLIHNHLSGPILARSCFSKLLSVLMFLTDSKCYDASNLNLNGFYRNATFNCAKRCVAAAA